MQLRTDLALEQKEMLEEESRPPEGVESDEIQMGPVRVTRIRVRNEAGERALGRKIGTYVTVEVPPLTDDAGLDENALAAVRRELSALLPEEGAVLVAGLGNTRITPDALGPKTAGRVLATRHIAGEVARAAGLGELRPVAVLAPGVLGQTGMETAEILAGSVERIRPAAVVVVDALASRRLNRLGCTVQISDTGISPGAGVGNRRQEISRATLGVPVVSMGVPTVVDAGTLAWDLLGGRPPKDAELTNPRGAGMIVTPREIDLLIDRAALLVAQAINCALQPGLDSETLLSLTQG